MLLGRPQRARLLAKRSRARGAQPLGSAVASRRARDEPLARCPLPKATMRAWTPRAPPVACPDSQRHGRRPRSLPGRLRLLGGYEPWGGRLRDGVACVRRPHASAIRGRTVSDPRAALPRLLPTLRRHRHPAAREDRRRAGVPRVALSEPLSRAAVALPKPVMGLAIGAWLPALMPRGSQCRAGARRCLRRRRLAWRRARCCSSGRVRRAHRPSAPTRCTRCGAMSASS